MEVPKEWKGTPEEWNAVVDQSFIKEWRQLWGTNRQRNAYGSSP